MPVDWCQCQQRKLSWRGPNSQDITTARFCARSLACDFFVARDLFVRCGELYLVCSVLYGRKFGLTTVVVSDRLVENRSHGDPRSDVQRCSLDRCSSWSFTPQTLAKTWRSTRSLWKRWRKICLKDGEQGPDASTSQAILTSSKDCCVQAMTTSGSSARCTDLNAGRVAMLTRVALRNRCGGTLWKNLIVKLLPPGRAVTIKKKWPLHAQTMATDVTARLHPGAQHGLENDVHTQQGAAVQHVEPLSSVRYDVRRWRTRLSISAERRCGDFLISIPYFINPSLCRCNLRVDVSSAMVQEKDPTWFANDPQHGWPHHPHTQKQFLRFYKFLSSEFFLRNLALRPFFLCWTLDFSAYQFVFWIIPSFDQIAKLSTNW